MALFLAVTACGQSSVTPTPCGAYGTFAPGCWPPGGAQGFVPYSATSPFDQQIPPAPKVRANSAAIVASIVGPMAQNKYPNNVIVPPDGTGGEPTYWIARGDTTTPRHHLVCQDVAGKSCAVQDMVPIPGGAAPENGASCVVYASMPHPTPAPDCHMVIADQDNNTEYDLYHVSVVAAPDSGGDFIVGNAAKLPLDGGDGTVVDPRTGGNANAAGFGELAGRVRAEELLTGQIHHALFIGLYCDSGETVYPARVAPPPWGGICRNRPGGIADEAAPPMGAWLRLRPDKVDLQHVPPWEIPYVTAMEVYGMYVGDTTSSSNYFSIESEGGLQYLSISTSGRSYPDQWAAWASSVHVPDGADGYPVGRFAGIDWASALEVLCQAQDTTAECRR